MIIDTHAHLNLPAFKNDRDEVIKRSIENGVEMINVGVDYKTSRIAVDIAEKYENIFAAIGLHPTDSREFFKKENYLELAKSKKVVAIGEIGLDYYRMPKGTGQKELLLKQLDLAKELNLPVIFHCRKAHNDLLEILDNYDYDLKGVVHSFTGKWREAKRYLEKGFYLGFNGIIFKLNLDSIIKRAPLEKMLVETDCPYLTPPEAKTKRNEPIFVKYVIKRIAEIKNISYEEVAKVTFENAKNLFHF